MTVKAFLKELIRAESTVQSGESAAAEVVRSRFGASGVKAEVDVWGGKRANVSARVPSSGGKPGLLFVCHLDVVGPGETPWSCPPFDGIEDGERVYGRGAADMKGGIVASVTAICEVVEAGVKLEGDVVFAATAGEETDSCGALRFVRRLEPGGELAGVVIPEPTGFSVVTAHRGMLWLKITTKGKAAHSSTPELGVNAICSMKAVLDELEDYEIVSVPHAVLGSCSMSVNTISGGNAMNVVPDLCTLGVDIRTVPGQDHQAIVADFEAMISRLREARETFKAEMSIIRQVDPMESDANSDFVRGFCAVVGAQGTEAVGYTTDAPHFVHLGAPVVIFGPGDSGLCHKPDEYVEMGDIRDAVEHYKRVILKFLA